MPTDIEAVIVAHVTVRHAAVFSLIGVPPQYESHVVGGKVRGYSFKNSGRIFENGE